MQASPLANTANAPMRKAYFTRLRTFATGVVVGVVLAFFLEFSLHAWSQVPPQTVRQSVKQSAPNHNAPQPVLELVALPQLPLVQPSLQTSSTPRNHTAHNSVAKNTESSQQKPEPNSQLENPDAGETLDVLDATDARFVEQGRRLLNDAEADIQIAFSLSAAPSERTKTLQALRECVGVRLALLNAQGDAVLEYEEALAEISPYGRELTGSLQNALLSEEYTTAYQWQKRYGDGAQVVRVYPLDFDARWLGVLNASLPVMPSKKGTKLQVNGRLVIQGDTLALDGLTVNGEPAAKKIVLARMC